jgi:hypothetical protein
VTSSSLSCTLMPSSGSVHNLRISLATLNTTAGEMFSLELEDCARRGRRTDEGGGVSSAERSAQALRRERGGAHRAGLLGAHFV